jgi:peptidoglycan/xylan/chitin deacetylase (PgdA/CDA1 family)
MYHRFGLDGSYRRLGVSEFEKQLQYLRAYFQPMRLSDLIECLRDGRRPPSGSVVLTVDDGYDDFATHAYPLLEKYQMPATVFVVSGLLDRTCWLWYDALRFLVDSMSAGAFEINLLSQRLSGLLTTPVDRYRLWTSLTDLGMTRSGAGQQQLVRDVAVQSGITLPGVPTPEFAGMTWDQARQMDPKLVDIGAHTRTHPVLARCGTTVQFEEVAGCKSDIERRLGRPITAFCYPNGLAGDFSAETESIVAQAGFRCAVMACGGLASRGSPLYRLERLGVPDDWPKFRNAVDGVWHLRSHD